MARKTYIILVDATTMSRMSEMVTRLQQSGFEVTRQLDATGVIVGSTEEANLAGIRSLPGVAVVEEERTFQLPPDTAL